MMSLSEPSSSNLLGSCQAHGINVMEWLEETLKIIPTEKDIARLLLYN